MKKLKAAFIGFIPRGLSFDETLEVLKQYHALGYSATEGANFLLNGDVTENRKRLEDIGMKALAVGLRSRKPDPENIKTAIENAKKAGVQRIATYASIAADYRFGGRPAMPTYDEMMQEIEDLNVIAKEFEKEGLFLTFHNHDAEFNTFFRRKPVFEYMVENSEYLKFQVDTGWALYGHSDPVEVLEYVGDKLHSVHIKDWTYGNVASPAFPGMPVDLNKAQNAMPHFTTPGNGFLPLRRVLKKAAEMGIEYAIVEQDFPDILDNENILRTAYLNMKETGYVE